MDVRCISEGLRQRWPLAAAGALLAAALAIYWPGYAVYDSITQFQQALSGRYDDWHPPIMARLWALLHATVGGGAGPMLIVQMGLYWLGFGLVATGLARAGRVRSAAVVLAIGAFPLFLGWQAVVLKDAQMAGALLAAIGLVAQARLGGRRLHGAGWAAVAVLLGYATLVRTNAVFATIPLFVLLLDRGPVVRLVLGAALIAGTLALAPLVNHRLLGAEPTSIVRAQPIFDLAGIAHFGGGDALAPEEAHALAAKRCYQPYFWDPLGSTSRCAGDLVRLQDEPLPALLEQWLGAILRHPLAYAEHRLAHWNATERWLAPRGRIAAAPPVFGESNTLGLVSPGPVASRVQRWAAVLAETPFGWPICYVALALAALFAAWRRPPDPARGIAIALLGSALLTEASFLAISIASDLRYHLWPMLATSVALVLLAERRVSRGALLGGAVLLTLAAGGGAVVRASLPPAPATYPAMLG